MTISTISEWKIDTSAGAPILTYKNCSVIESEQAEYVLSLIRNAEQPVLAVREAQSKPVALVDKRPFSNRVAWRNGGEKLQHGAELYTTPPAPAVPENVAAALDWIDDFIARCNGDDRGACNSVNVLRAAIFNHSGDSNENDEHVSQDYTLNSPVIPDCCDTMPNGQPVLQGDYFSTLVNAARLAADKAMQKHPQPNYVLLKVAEEAGEVVQAGVHYAEGRMTWQDLEGEIVQLLAMLIRLVSEGDQVNGINPPASCSTAALAAVPDEIDIFVDQVCGNLPAGHQQ